ncbi:MAG: sugar phosphate nucleotidyltransferase [Syntrophomonadaceae bacterium]
MTASAGRFWAIVLAGGQGVRLRPLVQRIHSDGRPKQFAVLVGERSLLRHTLDRVALSIRPERTAVVTTRSHARFFEAELLGARTAHVLVQPSDLGTAAGVLLPVHWISWRDPEAVVAVFPSDHFVADDGAFMRHVASLVAVVGRHPDRIVLVGATPDSAEPGYGWIEPGVSIEKTPGSGDVRTVLRFVEKPSPEEARACLARGALWNTFVMIARARTLLDAARRALPELHERLRRIRPFADTAGEQAAIERAYAFAPAANFSQSVLSADPTRLAVSELPPLHWSDWGTPERVITTLKRAGLAPRWLGELAPTA